jgi:hypothetical protein
VPKAKVIITTKYKKGQKGFILMESTDKKDGKPYAYYIILDGNNGKAEVFFEGEFKLVS